MDRKQDGFTLVELVAVLILVGILGATFAGGALPTSSFQLQSTRDRVVIAFYSAQQRAMAQTSSVRLSVSGGNRVDIRQDTDDDGDFSDESSLRIGGVAYPLTLPGNQQLTNAEFNFSRLGRTTASTLTLAQGSTSVDIEITAAGYVK